MNSLVARLWRQRRRNKILQRKPAQCRMSSDSSRVSKGRAKPPLELARLGYSYAAAPGQASSTHNCSTTPEDDAWPAEENCGRRQDSLWTERPRRLEAGQIRASASLATAKPLAPLAHSRCGGISCGGRRKGWGPRIAGGRCRDRPQLRSGHPLCPSSV